jgi:ubiquinone/menaquinone biosynthesis C-methylase UbiE
MLLKKILIRILIYKEVLNIFNMTIPIKILSKNEFERETKGKFPNQEEVWDSISNPWKTYVVKVLPVVASFLKDKQGKVLDLGCGSGRNMIFNSELEYYGIDFSEIQLKHAKEHIKKNKINANLFKLNAWDLSKFGNNSFDYGLFIATLHCLEGVEQRKKAISEFYRVLKQGAEALISVWDSEDKRFDCVKNKGDIYMSWREDGIPYFRYYYLYSKKELIELLENAGFKILECYNKRDKDRFSRKNLILRVEK